MAKKTKRKQLDLWQDEPSRIMARVNELLDKGAIAKDPEFEHIWHHRIMIPWAVGELSVTQFRKRMQSHNVPGFVNEHCTDLFKDKPLRTCADVCHGCGSKLTSDVCSCGLVSNTYDVGEMETVVYKSSYRPCQRFRKSFVRILRSVGYWAPESEFQAILKGYSLVVHSQTQQDGGGNLLNLHFIMFKLVELFIKDSFNKGLILQRIRLPKDSRRICAWDRRWAAIIDGLGCLEYKPTLRERRGYVGVKKYNTDDLDI